MANRVLLGRKNITATIDSQIGAGMFYMNNNGSGDNYTDIVVGQLVENTGYTDNPNYVTWVSGNRFHMTYSLTISAGTQLIFVNLGCWIGKAGKDVLTAHQEDLLFSTQSYSTSYYPSRHLFVLPTGGAAPSTNTISSTGIATNGSSGTATTSPKQGKVRMIFYGDDVVAQVQVTGNTTSAAVSRSSTIDNRVFDNISGLDYSNTTTLQKYFAINDLF